MTRMARRQIGIWAGLAAAGLIGGCGGLPSRKAEPPAHASTSLLDTGPAHKVTAQETADVQFALGRSSEEADKLDDAEKAYTAALTKAPKRADIEARLAIVFDRKGKPAEADAHFERALKLAPKDPEILCDRGYCFYLRRKPAEAEQSLRAALAQAPKHPRSHTNLGLVLATRGESEAAVAEFTRAGTDPADSRSNLALALALDGKIEAARDQYAQALAAKPKSPTATEGLRVATVALKKAALPALPGTPTPALAAGTPPTPATPSIDPALIPTSYTR